MTPTRHIKLQGAFNVRDLGGYKTATGEETPWRRLLRADALHELTPSDIDTLVEMGLVAIIDLRSLEEIERQPSRFADHREVAYHHISLFDGLAPVGTFMKDAGTFSLSARYIDAVEHCRPALTEAIMAVANAPEGLVLFNCTAGKDRTGLVAAALLSIAGVRHHDIAMDYALTGQLADPLIKRLKAAAVARGLEEAVATRLLSSEEEAMLALLAHVEDRHSSFRNYLANGAGHHAGLERLERRLASQLD